MIKKMCQSCGKILNRENKGTLDNGIFSENYCSSCFQNGEFTEILTLEEMQNKVSLSIAKHPIPKRVKQYIVSNLENLERWAQREEVDE